MNARTANRSLSLLVLSLCLLLATGGCKRMRDHLSDADKEQLAQKLEGRWTLDTSELSLSEDAPVRPSSTDASDKPSAEQVNSNLKMAEMFGLSIEFIFGADGEFQMSFGSETYEGTWAIPQKDGDRYVFVTRFPYSRVLRDQKLEGLDENATKQLVERLWFVDDNTIEIENDDGDRYRMTRAGPPAPNEQK